MVFSERSSETAVRHARTSSAEASVTRAQAGAQTSGHEGGSDSSPMISGSRISVSNSSGCVVAAGSIVCGQVFSLEKKEGGGGAHTSKRSRGEVPKGRQLAATHGRFVTGAGTESSPSSLDIVGSIVAVLILVVGAVYMKRFLSSRKSVEELPRYSSLDGG